MFANFLTKRKSSLVCAGDILIFALSLMLTIYVRYGATLYQEHLAVHIGPFSILLVLWIGVFYAMDLYSYTTWRTSTQNLRKFTIGFLLNFFLSISVFYLFGNFFELTPKSNLILFSVFFAFFDLLWRFVMSQVLSSKNNKKTIAIFSSSPLADEIVSHCKQHPQSGYAVEIHSDIEKISKIVHNRKEKIIVLVDASHLKDGAIAKTLYELLEQRVEISTLTDFYEALLGKIPLSEIQEEWFIQEIKADKSLYETSKRIMDIGCSIFALVLFSPFFLACAIMIPITSPGPIIYKQKRVGKDGNVFTLYKFRSMENNAEKNGAIWAQKNDLRTTKIGSFLRRTHIDELPQLFNILKGEVSFVGPRPERPEFTELLGKEIPHYFMRDTVTPGLTGWAQINYHYTNTVSDSKEKFKYDLYYIKHQNLFMDAGIIVKTIKMFF